MTVDDRLGRLDVEGDQATMTFRRRLPHPIEDVWAALTDPARRATWFGTTTIEPHAGGRITMVPDEPPIAPAAKEMSGRILVWQPPGPSGTAVLEHEWRQRIVEDGVVRYELTADGDGTLHLPFAYLYTVDGGLLDEDIWAAVPGWTSQEGAWRPEFDAHHATVVQRFTDRLGLPHHDIRQPRFPTRYASWRLEHNVVIVGQGPEPMSYDQFEDAHVLLLSRTAQDAPFSDSAAMRALLTS